MCIIIMLLFVVAFVILEYRTVQVNGVIPCNEKAEMYLQDGHIVQIKRNISDPGRITIEACEAVNITKPMELDPEKLLREVSVLELNGVAWPFLHVTSLLEQVFLNRITSIGLWGNCSRLKYIRVIQDNPTHDVLATVPSDWLNNCTKLQSLHLSNMNIAEILNLLDSVPNLKYLTIRGILDFFWITHYPLFSRNKNQKIIYVSISISYSIEQPSRYNITWPELSTSLMWQLSLLSFLEGIYIHGNNFDMCATGNPPPVRFRSLKSLQLENTNTSRLCLRHYYQAPQLDTLLLSYNIQARSPGFHMQIREMFSTLAPKIYVDLYNHGQVLSFDFTRDDYLALYDFENRITKKADLQLFGFRQLIKCDCYGPASWFARALRAGLVTAPGVLCTDFSAPADMSCDWLNCDRINCNSTCVCCREERNSVRADCRGTKIISLSEELLHFQNLTRLLVPNNNIVALPDHLPDTLLNFDLTGNNIWQAGSGQVGALFTQPKRHVRLGRNYLLCTCENMQLIAQLHNNKHQIDDFDSITCAITNAKLKNIDVAQLCAARDHDKVLIKHRETIMIAVVVSVIAAVACLVIAFILYQKRRELQIFLFARGWCLCCITEDKLDADRYYDVFISFCHADTTFVSEQLLPSLDREYSVCVHLRDWVPGEMIPSQITKSVEQSRRTVVVMSRNFVRSEWGRLEFQTAHVNGLADRRVRVVMIILDDVLEKDELAPELRSYVRLNTYVRWGDPWFWEKLRYALPHHPKPRVDIWTPPIGIGLQIEYDSREPNIEMMRIEGP